MLFCEFPVPEPSSPPASVVQTSVRVHTGYVPLEIPATNELQIVSKHKQGNSKGNMLLCSRSMFRSTGQGA